MKYEPIEKDHAMSAIGYSVHLGLRRGPAQDIKGAHELWKAIYDSDAWSYAVEYAIEELKYSGLVLCQIIEQES